MGAERNGYPAPSRIWSNADKPGSILGPPLIADVEVASLGVLIEARTARDKTTGDSLSALGAWRAIGMSELCFNHES